MGYTTYFKGSFYLNRKLDDKTEMVMRILWNSRGNGTVQPASYCQWWYYINSRGDPVIEWDQNEKFYYYIPWITYIVDEILSPRNYSLTGTMEWTGEAGDAGKIVIINNVINVTEFDLYRYIKYDKNKRTREDRFNDILKLNMAHYLYDE